MKLFRKRMLACAMMTLSILPMGCGGGADEANLSPRASADPARLEKAQRESEEAAARARKAEAAKTKGRLKVDEP